MGTIICKALETMQGPGFKTVRAGDPFSADVSFFTKRDGRVEIPRYVQVIGGDNLPAGTVILTKTSNKAARTPRATPSELMGRIPEPGQAFTIDTQGEQYSPAGLANELPGNMPGLATGEDLGLTTATGAGYPAPPPDPVGMVDMGNAAPSPAPPAAPEVVAFDRSAAFARLQTLTGKRPAGNPSNATLQALLEKAESAVMQGGQ